jgi:tetratricopeptide (TPR) repeat protein
MTGISSLNLIRVVRRNSKIVDWKRYRELIADREAGKVVEATEQFIKMSELETDPAARSVCLMEGANGFRRMRKWSEARRCVHLASRLLGPEHSEYIRPLYLEAAIDADSRDWESALMKVDAITTKYSSVLETPGNKDLSEDLRRTRGIALTGLAKFAEASKELEAVRASSYEHDAVLCYLGVCYFELGKTEACRQAFCELLERTPPSRFSATAHFYLGSMHAKTGQWARAKIEFEKTLACPDQNEIPRASLFNWLVTASRALNLTDDAEKYSHMLKTPQI